MHMLEKLWAGGLHPSEMPVRRSEGFKKAAERAETGEKKLTERLSREEKELFDAFMSDYASMRSYDEQESFTLGFRLGATLMIDVLCGGPAEEWHHVG